MSLFTLSLLSACSNGWFGKNQDPDGQRDDSGFEADADTDADSDTDTDADADADSDSDTDTDPDPDSTDDDGDGVSEDEGDCDDTDGDISPDADEVPYDGIDNDCDDSTPDDDLDGDGVLGADDCDDEDASSYPDADEVHGDGADNDCDGVTDERFETEVADTCDCGAPSAIDVDSSGNAHIAYSNSTDGYVYHLQRTKGGTWGSSSNIAPWNYAGEWLDLVVDDADRVQVVYSWNYGSGRQVEFVWRDSSSSWSDYFVVDDVYESGSSNLGAFCAIDVDSNNLPSMVYYDDEGAYGWTGIGNGVPVVADYSSLGVDYAVYSMVDENIWGDSGYYLDIAIDSSDNNHIVFTDFGADEVQYAAPMDGIVTETVYGSPGYDLSVALDASGTPCIAFMSANTADLMYGCRVGSEDWDIETIDSTGSTGAGASLAFDKSGDPWIAYYNETSGALKVATHDGSGWSIEMVDGMDRDAGAYPSLAIDSSGNVHISYYDVTNGQLMYAVGN